MRSIAFLVAVVATAPLTAVAAQDEKPRLWTLAIGAGFSPFDAEAFSQDMHYNDGFDDYFINPDQDARTSVVSVMFGTGRSFYRVGSLAVYASLNFNLLLNFPLTGLVFELAAEPRWSANDRLYLFGRLGGGLALVSGEVGEVPLGNNTGASVMLSPSGQETAPVNSVFKMEGSSFGGSIGGGAGVRITPLISVQGDLTYRAYGDIDDWTIKVLGEKDGNEFELFEMEISDFESDGEPGAIGVRGLSFGLNLAFSF